MSPDGRTLLFSRVSASFVPALYWMSLADGVAAADEPQAVPIEGMVASYPTWMPDSKGALFSAAGHLWRKTVRSGDPRCACRLSGRTASCRWCRIPTSGGAPVNLLDQVVQRAFTVLDKGIYFVEGAASETRLQFFDLATSRTTMVARNLGQTSFGLAASPDGRIILYSKVDIGGEDIMLVENFR